MKNAAEQFAYSQPLTLEAPTCQHEQQPAEVTPPKGSSRDWNTLIVMCASTILIALVIGIELFVLPR